MECVAVSSRESTSKCKEGKCKHSRRVAMRDPETWHSPSAISIIRDRIHDPLFEKWKNASGYRLEDYAPVSIVLSILKSIPQTYIPIIYVCIRVLNNIWILISSWCCKSVNKVIVKKLKGARLFVSKALMFV